MSGVLISLIKNSMRSAPRQRRLDARILLVEAGLVLVLVPVRAGVLERVHVGGGLDFGASLYELQCEALGRVPANLSVVGTLAVYNDRDAVRG